MKHLLIILLLAGQVTGQHVDTLKIDSLRVRPVLLIDDMRYRHRLVTDIRLDTVMHKLDSIIYLLNNTK